MCLAVPGKVISLEGDHARIEYTGGIIREANISLVEATVGLYVIVHAGFAIQLLDEKEALETLSFWEELLGSEKSAGDAGREGGA
ncbi:MAG: HypC/HybG/HupF family hydrogenase formation chaperone [Thermoplasmata archaeon]|nr:HypC/HybG/HupF family hydrogenase formation chaperone [Thermoplasmata archaeon]